MYWSSVKDYITESLKEKIEKVRPLQKQYVECQHKMTIPLEARIALDKKHAKEAQMKMKKEKFQKKIE